jgi:hypothetical protein
MGNLPFDHLAAEMAASPGLVETLLAAHIDDGHGFCATCTSGGVHAVRMACALRALAEYAARLRPAAVAQDAATSARPLRAGGR